MDEATDKCERNILAPDSEARRVPSKNEVSSEREDSLCNQAPYSRKSFKRPGFATVTGGKPFHFEGLCESSKQATFHPDLSFAPSAHVKFNGL